MKLKSLSLFLLGAVALLVLSSCANQTEAVPLSTSNIDNTSSLYQSENVQVTLLEPAPQKNYNCYEWIDLHEETVFTKNSIIFSGNIQSIREAVVEYEFMDVSVKDNITLLEVDITEIIHNSSNIEFPSDTVTVGLPYNDYTYGEGLPILETGKSFLMFAYPTEGLENDSLELSGYTDLWLNTPNQLLIEEVEGKYIAGSFFSNYLDSTTSISSHLDIPELSSEVSLNTNLTYALANMISSSAEDSTTLQTAIDLLSERINPNNSEDMLWALLSESHLIEKQDFEDIISDIAANYQGD